MTGEWPQQVDHIDGDRLNNAWSNLRNCTIAENNRNKGLTTRSKTGHKNIVKWGNLYAVRIKKDYIEYRWSSITSLKEAIELRNIKLIELHGEFARTE
jgi:hypothetical protein